MKASRIYLIPFFILTLLLFIYFLWQIDLQNFKQAIYDMNYLLVFFSIVVYFLLLYFRALRFKGLIFSKKVPTWGLLKIVSCHNLAARLLPVKTGELAYPLLLKKEHGVDYGEGVSTLAIVRFFDVIFLSIILVGALLLNLSYLQSNGSYLIVSVGIIVVLLFLYVLVLNNKKALSFLVNVCQRHDQKKGIPGFVIKMFNGLFSAFVEIKKQKKFFETTIYTAITWVLAIALYFLIIHSLSIESLTFSQSLLAIAIFNAVIALPVSVVAEVGTFEAGYVFTTMFFGLSKEAAISSAVIFHLFVVASGLLFFLMFYFNDIFISKSFYSKISSYNKG